MLVGVIMVLVAHGHYTVDVLIAYYVTTRLWYIYHTLANNSNLKVRPTFGRSLKSLRQRRLIAPSLIVGSF